MYIILYEEKDPIRQVRIPGCYQSYFTEDMEKVAKCLKEGAKVYKLDSLTKVKEIEVTYQEIIEEAEDE